MELGLVDEAAEVKEEEDRIALEWGLELGSYRD